LAWVLIDFSLICVSIEFSLRCQTPAMISQQNCVENAQMCEARATDCGNPAHRSQWLEMAAVWHELAGDRNGQATLARLMNMNGIAGGPVIAAYPAHRPMARNLYIVDDDDSVRASLHGLLALRPDQAVHSFPSGDRFLADAGSLDPGVLLLDFHMPGADGMEVLHALRERYRGKFAPLILTGAASDGIAVRALRAGALDFIEKPYETSLLLDAVDAAFSSLAKDNAAAQRATAARARIDSLSDRERDVLMCLIEGHANRVIASALDISSRTVEIYRANLLTKLSVGNLSAAFRIVTAAGMIPQL
jgi:two-component system response regulator FixJ